MMRKLWEAHLVKSSPRYCDWRVVLDGDDVPLLSPVPVRAILEGEGPEEIYALDLDAFSEDQFERLVFFVSRKFNTPHARVWQEIKARGFPIRASDCCVVFYDFMKAFI
jgi:hypothetical protein